jgi:hypothetical protein
MQTRWRATLKSGAGFIAVGVVLGLVFLAYLNPALMQSMADAVWACF